MNFLKMFYSIIFSFLVVSFQAFSSERCRFNFFSVPLEELGLSFETGESLQNKGVGSLSDLLLEEEKELTEPDQLKSLLRRLKEEVAFRVHFSPLTLREIQRIFSDKGNYTKYRGQKGYVLFVKRTPNTNSMNYVFNLVSRALEEDFKRLRWQQFRGPVEEFEGLRGKILDEEGRLKEKHRDMPGQALFARDHYGGDMKKTFVNISAVLDKEVFKLLGWQKFQGSVEEFEGLRGKILVEEGKLKEKYQDMSGQALFARAHYGGDMSKTFLNISAVLDKEVFKLLGWRKFQGSVEEFEGLPGKILDEEGRLKEKYQDMPGQALFARAHYGGDMSKTFLNISAVLDKEVFKLLGWRKFQGSVEEFEGLRGKILDEEGRLKEKYQDMSGQARFARDHYGGDMNKTFRNVSVVLDKEVFKLLDWQSFQGPVEEFEGLRGKILDEDERLKEKYQDMSGQVRFARDHYGRDMSKTFQNVSAVLGGRINMKLFGLDEWKAFQGSSVEYYDLIQLFQESEVEELQGLEGQRKVAEEIFEGNKRRAYRNVSLLREVLVGNNKPLEDTLKWLPNSF